MFLLYKHFQTLILSNELNVSRWSLLTIADENVLLWRSKRVPLTLYIHNQNLLQAEIIIFITITKSERYNLRLKWVWNKNKKPNAERAFQDMHYVVHFGFNIPELAYILSKMLFLHFVMGELVSCRHVHLVPSGCHVALRSMKRGRDWLHLLAVH